jgi:hypothetical protein
MLADVARKWHADGTTSAVSGGRGKEMRSDQDLRGGDDGTRTHDPLLANPKKRTNTDTGERETAGQLTFWMTPNNPE